MTHAATMATRAEPPVPFPPGEAPARAGEQPVHRSVTAHVTGGVAGVMRVAMMLHSRRYPVRTLHAEIGEEPRGSRVSCAVELTSAQADLLLERLRRIPAVVSAENS